MLKTLIGGAALAATITAIPTMAHAAPKTLTCDGSFTGGTYFSVTVPAGASCTLIGAKVTHGVHARGAANVSLIDTNVAHNVNIRGTTGLTEIKSAGCKVDPVVGNNVMVRRSHDVLICEVHAKDNIMVTGNDGMITVRDSAARANIMVNHNLAFTGPIVTHHARPGAIRILRDTAGHHIHVFRNDRSRVLILKGDSPAPVVK